VIAGWLSVRDLAAGGSAMDALVDHMLATAARSKRDVAASYLAGGFAEVIVARAAHQLRMTGSTWSVEADHLDVHVDDAGWFDDARSAGGDAITSLEVLADQTVATITPLFAELRARLPFGLIGMWGTVADALFDDPPLLELVRSRVGTTMRVLPRAHLIEWRGGVHRQLVRGTCCLWYKVFPEESGCEASPDGDGYCWSCPHRSDESRAALVAADLSNTAS
jgi:hypothetical protein